jgi:hypothetical protein
MSSDRDPDVYPPRSIKRQRSTKAEMKQRLDGLFDILQMQQPMTVRQVFYQATVKGLVEKTEQGYGKVKADLANLRRDGVVPYHWLADNTRMMRKPRTYAGIQDAIERTADFYRRDLWYDSDVYCEIWLEKDALGGVVWPVTSEYDVPLMVSRGYASLSFLHSAAESILAEDKPAYIYHFGDFDPSGQDAARHIEEQLREFAPDADIYFERVAVTPEQIEDWDLPTRPTKASDSRSKTWTGGNKSVELDAIAPDDLRALVRECIEEHLPPERLEQLKIAEKSEREAIQAFAEAWFEEGSAE